MEKDNILTGFVIGCMFPVLGFMTVSGLFSLLGEFGLMEASSGMASGHRLRTVALIAICSNLIPFNYFKNQKADSSMRGIIFPTLVYVGFWFYKYYNVLFGS